MAQQTAFLGDLARLWPVGGFWDEDPQKCGRGGEEPRYSFYKRWLFQAAMSSGFRRNF